MSKRKQNAKQPVYYRGRPDYKSAFSEAVSAIIAEKIPDRTERMRRITELTDEYVAATGERPDGTELERLTDAVLHEELTDQRRNKMTAPEYPFMSDWQLAVRQNREYGIHLADERGTDGRNHKRPVRRKRTERENRSVDMFTRSRNAERRRQYRKDTAPGELISYKLATS